MRRPYILSGDEETPFVVTPQGVIFSTFTATGRTEDMPLRAHYKQAVLYPAPASLFPQAHSCSG